MIIITGAAGFISSCVAARLNEEGFKELVLVDDFSSEKKKPNYLNRAYRELVDREEFFDWANGKESAIQFIIHLGARTDTTEFDRSIFDHLNLGYSRQMWQLCTGHSIPLIYASSAATYGGGELGFDDSHEIIPLLKPLNPYGESKNDFDIWALGQEEKPFFWAGLKFFNVYGPNEYHKGRMASVILHAHRQIGETGGMKLFQSHNPDYRDGEQIRDFVYVKDVADVIYWLMNHRKNSGIYNLGSSKARTFLDLTRSTFAAMDLEPKISFIPTPEDIRDKYQYFTEANMDKLRQAGYERPFTPLEVGVEEYVREYLSVGRYW